MKKILLATLLLTQSNLSFAESNEGSNEYNFNDGNNKYMHTIGFDSKTSNYTVLSKYPYYHNNTTVMVGIFDSGYFFNHEDLKNRLTSGTSREDMHGTLVAGIIGAEKDNNLGYTGIIKPKKMYGMSYYHKSSAGDRRLYIKSLCSFFDVINISQTLSKTSYRVTKSKYDDESHLSIMNKWRDIFVSPECMNTLFVISGGNSKVDSRKENGGLQYLKTEEGYKHIPASNIIITGAIQGNEITQNYGESIDIYAPEKIGGPSEVIAGISLYTDSETGSSITAPQVTGVAAMIQREIKRNPGRLKEYLTTKPNLTMISKVKGSSTATTSRPILNAFKIVEKVVNDFGPGI
jgi:hypothetical protein